MLWIDSNSPRHVEIKPRSHFSSIKAPRNIRISLYREIVIFSLGQHNKIWSPLYNESFHYKEDEESHRSPETKKNILLHPLMAETVTIL